MRIGGIQKSSLLDFPNMISAIVFTKSCNFACGYCHNPELFSSGVEHSTSEFFDFLDTRKGKLDGIVITGGEPCLQPDLIDFIRQIKLMGFLVKLDTNGSFPDVIQNLLDENLLDYIAMDIKAPIEKYNKVTNSIISTDKIIASINLIMNSNIDYEFRTTVVKSQLNFEDFEKIGNLIKGAKKYYLQKFVPTKTLNPTFLEEQTYNDEDFKRIIDILTCKISLVEVR
ncbi:MAG: anaerobic ribonucleoside-triphosphate reductase activating protein [Cyanobacteria bacterium SIG32]|nr:anaerobic ribonucleoside-triphosphate reductase activating protein [Cyanobacteria bacterium SIG32]